MPVRVNVVVVPENCVLVDVVNSVEVVAVLLVAVKSLVTCRFAVANPESAPLVTTVIGYEPDSAFATVNEPVRLPPEIEHVWAPTPTPVNVQVVSLA